MKVPAVLKNKYLFYALAVLAALNVIGYACKSLRMPCHSSLDTRTATVTTKVRYPAALLLLTLFLAATC